MRLSSFFRSHVSRTRSRARRLSFQSLERRDLLTGLVMEESVFSVTQFAENIEDPTNIPVDPLSANGVVGFSYAIIAGDPDNPVSGAGGSRRLPQDGFPPAFPLPVPMNPTVPQAIASTSKPITAAAILHLLQEQVLADPETYPDFQAGMNEKLDQNIVEFLPENWGPGAGTGWAPFFNRITIRELLTHTSGLLGSANAATGGVDSTNGGSVFSGGGNRYNYSGLQQIAENGIVNFVFNPVDGTTSWPADYWTNNYSWFRVMLPYMWDEISDQELTWNAQNNSVSMSTLVQDDDLADELRDAIEDDWGVVPVLGQYGISPAQLTASIYKFYVTKYLLNPAGVENPQANTSGTLPTLFYPINPGSTPGLDPSDPTAGALTSDIVGDQRLNLGPRSWFLSAEDLTRAITGIRHGATDGTPILIEETRDLMDAETLGWGTGNASGIFGTYYNHSGGNFRPPGSGPPPVMNNTHVMAFPNGVEASIQFNSQIQVSGQPTVIGAEFNSAGTTTGIGGLLANAYDNAWTELVYDGDDFLDGVVNTGDEHDTFRIALNGSQFIDFFHDNMTTPVFTRHVDTLTRITINGFDGANFYQIDSLPDSVEIVINGGNFFDDVTLGDPSFGVNTDDLDQFAPGTLTFNGGAGFSRLTINDNGNGNPSGEFYIVRDDEVTRSGAGVYNYNNIDELNLNTSGWSDDVFILGTQLGAITNVNTDFEADNVTIGNTAIDFVRGNVNLLGSTNDTVRFADTSSETGHTYDINVGQTVIDGLVIVTYTSNDLEVATGDGMDVVNINSLSGDQELDVETDEGQNDVNVNLLGNPLTTSVLGKVIVHGGDDGDDTLRINDATSLNGTDYTITGSTVHRPGIQTIEYDGIETLNVDGAVPASTYNFHSTSAATHVTGGLNGDTFDIGQARLDFIDGPLTINGGDNFVGEDTVEFTDFAGASSLYILANNALAGATFAPIQLNDVEQATLDANPFNNDFYIENAPGPTRYTINGGSGDDTFELASNSESLSTFNTPLIINGGFDDNTLILNDASSPGGLSFTVTQNSIDRLLFGEHSLSNTDIGVTFHAMNDVVLYMNEHSSNVNVQSTNPNTKYIFHGNDGHNTLNLNRHTDNDADPLVDIDGIAITSATMDIEHHDFEQLNLNLGDELNKVRVHDLDSPASINLGLGDDRVLVTPDSEDLNDIHFALDVNGQGGTDRLHLLDGNFGLGAHYTVTEDSVDRILFGPLVGPGVTYNDLDIVRLFMGPGDNVLHIESTAAGTEYLFDGGLGDDTFNVNSLPKSPITLFGNVGEDRAVITGTAGKDEVSVSAGFGTADINMPNTETATFDGLGGSDVLVAEGVVGSDEQMEIEASATAGAGELRIITTTPRGDFLLDLAFENTETLDVVGNFKEMDTATFIGTDLDDEFKINLGAAGTNDDPVLLFFQPGSVSPLLALRNYLNFGTLGVEGRDGADKFNVFVAPTGPGTEHRNLLVDGGLPSGPENNGDELTVYWQQVTPTPPPADPPPAAGSPVVHDQGLDQFFADYDAQHRFTIDYLDIEQATSKNANAAG